MRRAALLAVVLAALAGAAIVTLGSHTHARAAVRPPKPPRAPAAPRSPAAPAVPAAPGHTCFASVPDCSQTPCVEFVQGAAATAVYRVVPVLPRPRATCRPSAPPRRITARLVPGPRDRGLAAALKLARRALARELAHRLRPAGG